MADAIQTLLTPGKHIQVTQQIPARDYVWSQPVRGTVVEYTRKTTGSWFAHSQGQKLWLDRLVLRKDDGEITTLNLDQYSRIEPDETAADPSA